MRDALFRAQGRHSNGGTSNHGTSKIQRVLGGLLRRWRLPKKELPARPPDDDDMQTSELPEKWKERSGNTLDYFDEHLRLEMSSLGVLGKTKRHITGEKEQLALRVLKALRRHGAIGIDWDGVKRQMPSLGLLPEKAEDVQASSQLSFVNPRKAVKDLIAVVGGVTQNEVDTIKRKNVRNMYQRLFRMLVDTRRESDDMKRLRDLLEITAILKYFTERLDWSKEDVGTDNTIVHKMKSLLETLGQSVSLYHQYMTAVAVWHREMLYPTNMEQPSIITLYRDQSNLLQEVFLEKFQRFTTGPRVSGDIR